MSFSLHLYASLLTLVLSTFNTNSTNRTDVLETYSSMSSIGTYLV